MDSLPGHAYRAMTDFVATAGRRRSLAPCLHVGLPGGEQVRLPDRPWYDAAGRADLVSRALEGLGVAEPIAWVSRTGELRCTDLDLSWSAACRHAFGRHRLDFPGLVLVTRHGWANLATGEQHRWARVRQPRERRRIG